MAFILLYISYIILSLNLGYVSGIVIQIDDSNWKQVFALPKFSCLHFVFSRREGMSCLCFFSLIRTKNYQNMPIWLDDSIIPKNSAMPSSSKCRQNNQACKNLIENRFQKENGWLNSTLIGVLHVKKWRKVGISSGTGAKIGAKVQRAKKLGLEGLTSQFLHS